MPETLLRTKLFVPPLRPNLIRRQRLIQRLDEGLQPGHKLTLISAPAGFGKTTLVSAWAQQTKQPIAWLSLEESDNDLTRFLSYFVAALQTVDGNIGEGISDAFQSPRMVNVELVLTALLNQTSQFSHNVVLVLDDYHVIASKLINRAAAFLLDHLSPQMHLVISTRADPPFPLPRMRARGELLEIRAKDLRFSLDESAIFLGTMLGSDVSGENLQTLQRRTEGWIASLQLAALAIQDHEDPSGLIAAFGSGHDYIVDYLIEEVLNRQPESVIMFLLQTSILDRLNGSLCNALTGRSDGNEMLDWLVQANLLVSPLGGEHRWYRYHHLLAEVMVNRLQRLHQNQLPELHLQAAEWFQQNSLFAEAIKHALAANAYPYAADLVESKATELLRVGSVSTLLNWLNKLPVETVNKRPRLSIFSAWAYLLIGKHDRIEGHLSAAESNLTPGVGVDSLRGNIAAIRAYAAVQQGNFNEAIDQADQALKLLPADDFPNRAVVSFVMGGMYQMQRDIPRALASMKEASQLGERAGNIHVAVQALSSMGAILLREGNLAQAERVFDQAIRLGHGGNGQPLPITASAHVGLAELCLAQKELNGARQFAEKALELGDRGVNAESQAGSYLALAQIEHLEGDPDGARTALEKARRLAATHQLPPSQEEQIKACETAILAAPGVRDDQGLLDPLSDRELEILGLFAAGLSNQEIAEKLIISLGTVKAHSSHIYRKLDVRGRTQAIIRANELKLL